jgi:hypothetical protein
VAAADPYALESVARYEIRANLREIRRAGRSRVHEHHADPSGRFSVFEDIRLPSTYEATRIWQRDRRRADRGRRVRRSTATASTWRRSIWRGLDTRI